MCSRKAFAIRVALTGEIWIERAYYDAAVIRLSSMKLDKVFAVAGKKRALPVARNGKNLLVRERLVCVVVFVHRDDVKPQTT